MARLYLAGGLFNAGERLHNLHLEQHLKALGHEVILPQREALLFRKADGTFDLGGVVADCREKCSGAGTLCVACLDGTDADSGTAVEYGMAISATGNAITYRTDFRTAPEHELGANAMFKARRTEHVYLPCFFTELGQTGAFYRELAQSIHEAAERLSPAALQLGAAK